MGALKSTYRTFLSSSIDRANLLPGAVALIFWMAIHTFIAVQNFVPRNFLTRDPLVLAKKFISRDGNIDGFFCCHPYLGFLSNVGVVLWFMGGAVALAGAAVISRGERRKRGFILAGGLFSLLLGYDDLFQAHEYILPNLGIPEIVTLTTYAIAASVYFIFAVFVISDRRSPFLVISFFLFFLSILIDMNPDSISRSLFWEDTLKFGGIIFWSTFQYLVTVDAIRNQLKASTR